MFRIEEVSSLGDLKTEENQGLNFRRYNEGLYPRYNNRVEINVGTIKEEKRKVHIGEERETLKRITLIQVGAQDREDVRVSLELVTYYHTSLIKWRVQTTC